MKKPDRPARPRIPAKTEKKDPWRDAPKEEILARGKKKADRPASEPHAKRKESGKAGRPQHTEARSKKEFGGERKNTRDEGAQRNERGSSKKSAFKKGDERGPRKEGERDATARPRRMAKSFGNEVKGERGERKTFNRRDDRPDDGRAPRGEKPFAGKSRREDRGEERGPARQKDSFSRKPHRDGDGGRRTIRGDRPAFNKPNRGGDRDERAHRDDARPARDFGERKPRKDAAESAETDAPTGGPMTLNKYLAHAGLSSRRDAATAIKEGKVKVNGETLTTPGYRVQPSDKVTFEGKPMKPQVKKVYVLLNKPKGFITTTDDEQDRRTVMELVQSVEAERIYPVGRLDRNTTGLLLLTNDGDLAQRLTHPKYEAKKIYQVGLDKPLTKADFEKLLAGVELEDGIAKPDKLSFLETPSELGIEIHSGRNRIVRRMFEALGYEVEKLDRVMFAGLTKKNIPRGQWRHLTEEEVVRLKHFKS